MTCVQTGVFLGAKEITQENRDDVRDIMRILNEFLEETAFMAGDNLTIADLSILPNVTSFVVRNKVYTMKLHSNTIKL